MFKVFCLVVFLCLFSGDIMANERDFSGAYSVVPILHKDSGEVHDVAVPADLTLGDLHGILLNSGYHGAETKPTAEGAVENSDAFRRNAKKAVTQSVMGVVDKGKGGEAGFTVQRSGTTSPVEWQPDEDPTSSGHIKQKIESEDLGALHTHDYRHSATPSADDIEAAQKAHRVIWVTSRAGLFSVDPSGKVEQIFSKPDWYKQGKK
jgi:hypothetical protein